MALLTQYLMVRLIPYTPALVDGNDVIKVVRNRYPALITAQLTQRITL
jgi:hypothetical protein